MYSLPEKEKLEKFSSLVTELYNLLPDVLPLINKEYSNTELIIKHLPFLKVNNSKLTEAINFIIKNGSLAWEYNNFESKWVFLADKVGLSRSRLISLFKEYTWYTPEQVLNKIILQLVCRDLTSTQKGIEQIAVARGFNDKSNFSRRFKQEFGITPTEYRNKIS